jgi:hypothetical protein
MATGAGPKRAPGLAAALGALGLLCAYIAAAGLTETFAGLSAGASPVLIRAGAAAAAPAAFMLLLLALLLVREPSASGRREKRLFGAVLACLPLLVVLPMGLNWIAGTRLADQGYRQCAGPMGSRGVLTRTWTRADAPCPAA